MTHCIDQYDIKVESTQDTTQHSPVVLLDQITQHQLSNLPARDALVFGPLRVEDELVDFAVGQAQHNVVGTGGGIVVRGVGGGVVGVVC